jgi:hypothetical protein
MSLPVAIALSLGKTSIIRVDAFPELIYSMIMALFLNGY